MLVEIDRSPADKRQHQDDGETPAVSLKKRHDLTLVDVLHSEHGNLLSQ